MKFKLQIDQDDIERVRELIKSSVDKDFVQKRIENLKDNKTAVDRSEFWQQMVSARMTSVQRSGPDSSVGKFTSEVPFLLSYEAVVNKEKSARRGFIADTLCDYGGIRFYNRIAEDLCKNLDKLSADQKWDATLKTVNDLRHLSNKAAERDAAKFIQDLLDGFGPKQARNLLQSLGMIRYEIPIDSRVIKWLKGFDFPIPLSAEALSDMKYYEFVLDAVQQLCAKSDVFPCILDAAIFASFDNPKN
jgi:hypothetical protein